MADRLFLDERELRAMGMTERNIRTFRTLAEYVQTQQDLAAAQADIDANAADIAALTANDVALDTRLDALEANAPYVSQDSQASPAYSAYAGQTVSAGYVQAEAQATDDAVKAASIALDTLIDRLVAANVLT